MKMFMLKSLLLASLMFFSVLFGMQQANEGIHNMKGYKDSKFDGAFTIAESDSGDMQVSVLGNDVNSHDLEKKKETLEEIKAYNIFSSMGRGLAEGISKISEKTIQFISDILN